MIELLRLRRSVRKFTEQPVEDEKLDLLKEAALRSPSSKNINPWGFIFVSNKEILQKLKKCKAHGVTPLESAPLAIIVGADQTKTDVWIEDCAIASLLLHLTAESIGLGSCWIQIRERFHSDQLSSEQYIQQLLGIPHDFRILSIIAAGYPKIKREGKQASELQFEKIKINRF